MDSTLPLLADDEMYHLENHEQRAGGEPMR